MGHPHDTAFKRIFGHPALATDLMRRRVPAALLDRLDLDRCAPVTGEFLDRGLRNRRADLVFRIPFKAPGERVAFVFMLVEHQSTPDPLMAFRVLAYAVEVGARWLEQHRAERQSSPDRLPAVIPLVVHQGRRPWRGPRSLSALIDLPDDLSALLGAHLPQLELLIDDLAVPDDARTGRTRLALTGAALLAMRYVRRERDPDGFLTRLTRLVDASIGEPGRSGIIEAVFQYVYDESERLSPDAVLAAIEQTQDPETREVLMSLSDKLRAEGREAGLLEGRQLGRAEGRQLGRAEGRQEARAAFVLDLIRHRFGDPSPDLADRITAAIDHDHGAWLERILAARSLADLEESDG